MFSVHHFVSEIEDDTYQHANTHSFLIGLRVRLSFPKNTDDRDCRKYVYKLDIDKDYRVYNYFTNRDGKIMLILYDYYDMYVDARQFSPSHLNIQSTDKVKRKFNRKKKWKKYTCLFCKC
jgi:hypothetical protein